MLKSHGPEEHSGLTQKPPKLEDPGLNSLEQLQLALPTLPPSRAMKCAELPGQEGCRLRVPASRTPSSLSSAPSSADSSADQQWHLPHWRPGTPAGVRDSRALPGRERAPSGSAAVCSFCAWYSEGKLMRVWRAVRKITASFFIKDKSQAE